MTFYKRKSEVQMRWQHLPADVPLAFGMILALVAALVASDFAFGAPADEIHWTFSGTHAVTVDWRGGTDSLWVGERPYVAHVPSPLPFSSAGPWREARVDSLPPGVATQWRIDTESGTFHAPPAPGSSGFMIAAFGDVGDSISYPTRVGPIARMVAADQPAFCLVPGDLTYGNSHGQSHVDQHFNDMQYWSRNAAYMMAFGNHERDSGDDPRNYRGRFAFPNPRASPGSPTPREEDWCFWDYGNVRFISYPEPYSGAWAAWRLSADSLMDAVDADPNIDWIVTFGHRPAFSSGHHPGNATLAGYLNTLGDQHPKYVLNINAHSHNYERIHPQHGVTHITVGGGGATLEVESGSCGWAGGCPAPSYTAFRAFRHGYVRVLFMRSGLQVEAVCGPASTRDDITCTPGSVIDRFVIGAVPVEISRFSIE